MNTFKEDAMYNAIVYKVFRRGRAPLINMFVSFDLIDCVETVLYEHEYRFGTCRVELVAVFDFTRESVFECMTAFANETLFDVDSARLCNKRLVAMLLGLEKSDAERHCRQGFDKWIEHVGSRLERRPKSSSLVEFARALFRDRQLDHVVKTLESFC